ncbi:tetratricopeptide repeat protein, tpr, putative [Perkinsus marinus ATCC 50983]|uniref:Tetratricopeptide repeat protein, tpr, putative n=1 Tax=Perkinsus marinus (strain ATCC 50983 / TXsc) TaxID=423536 RepID=C5LZQ7_PERM5|nr:tetratricopeptide repeat protein, tpr, putative [Perkinsus marinus ATCC 50983]EEQ97725.1 tetratricopeptide repeat protein, tpr, putative [Perkinsus marinus ATCC 50983]|eukprot:XP_002765008.1 tetratricopeptide repeat protein, tpr, putative [Perkinsus marinus ATCC 50983]
MLANTTTSFVSRFFTTTAAASKAASAALPFANLAKAEAALKKHEEKLKKAQHDLLLKYASLENHRREREKLIRDAEKKHVRVFASSLVDVADKMNEAGQLADQLSSKAEASEKLKSVAEGVSIARDFLKYQIESFSVDKGEKFDVARHEISPESAIKEVKKGEEAIVDGSKDCLEELFYLLGSREAVSGSVASEREHGIALLTEAIKLAPDKAILYALRAKALAHNDMLQRALLDFSMAIRLEPAVAKHYGSRGDCFSRLERWTDALGDYTEAMRHDKDSGRYVFDRARVYFEIGDYISAARDFTTALSRECSSPFKAYLCRGISRRHNKDVNGSVEDLKKAVELNEADTDAHDHLGLSLFLARDYNEALAAFTKAVSGCSTLEEGMRNARYLNHRGLVRHHLGEYEKAIEDFIMSLELNPHDHNTCFNRGNTYCCLGEYDKALADYATAMEIDPKNAEYSHYEGLVYQKLGRMSEAIECFQRALEKDQTYLAAMLHLGIMYRECGKTEDAFRCFMDDRFERINDNKLLAQVHQARGLICEEMKRAIELLELVREETPESKCALEEALRENLFHRGMVRSELGDYEKALEDLSERGMCWKYLGNLPEAISDLSAAVEKSGGKVLEYLSNRAQCFLEYGLYGRADDDLCKAIAMGDCDGDGNYLYYRRGVARFVQLRYEEAIKDLERAVESDRPPEECMADLYYHLGVCEVLRWQPLNSRALFRRAFSFKALKMFDEAAEDFEAARELEPDDIRFVVDYKKIADFETVTLCPAGHEDQLVYRDPGPRPEDSVDEGLVKFEKLIAEVVDDAPVTA